VGQAPPYTLPSLFVIFQRVFDSLQGVAASRAPALAMAVSRARAPARVEGLRPSIRRRDAFDTRGQDARDTNHRQAALDAAIRKPCGFLPGRGAPRSRFLP